MNTKLHAVADANGRPLPFVTTASQISTIPVRSAEGAATARQRGYDADRFREAFQAKGIRACITNLRSRNEPVRDDKRRYRRCNRIESMFGRLNN